MAFGNVRVRERLEETLWGSVERIRIVSAICVIVSVTSFGMFVSVGYARTLCLLDLYALRYV